MCLVGAHHSRKRFFPLVTFIQTPSVTIKINEENAISNHFWLRKTALFLKLDRTAEGQCNLLQCVGRHLCLGTPNLEGPYYSFTAGKIVCAMFDFAVERRKG